MRLIQFVFCFFATFPSFSQSKDSIPLIEMILFVQDENAPSNVEVILMAGDSTIFSDTIYVDSTISSEPAIQFSLLPDINYTIITKKLGGLESRDYFNTLFITMPTRFIREVRLFSPCKPLVFPNLKFEPAAHLLTDLQKEKLIEYANLMALNPRIVVQLYFHYKPGIASGLIRGRNAEVLAFLKPRIDHIERVVIKNIQISDADEVQAEMMSAEIISFDFDWGK